MINRRLLNQGILWPISLDRIAGSGVDPSRSSIYPLTSYWFSNDRKLKFNFFKIHIKYVVFISAQLKFWFQTDFGRENSASCYRQGRQLLLTFLTMVTRWSRSMSNFYALIGQNLTGEFMRKIYAASWILFTLTAEADRVLCQLVMFLTVFSTGCPKWNSAAIRSLLLFMASLFIGFLVEKCVTCQSRKSDFGWHYFRFSPCLMRKRVERSEAIYTGFTWYLSGAASRMVSLCNYCIWCSFFVCISNLMKSTVVYVAM